MFKTNLKSIKINYIKIQILSKAGWVLTCPHPTVLPVRSFDKYPEFRPTPASTDYTYSKSARRTNSNLHVEIHPCW